LPASAAVVEQRRDSGSSPSSFGCDAADEASVDTLAGSMCRGPIGEIRGRSVIPVQHGAGGESRRGYVVLHGGEPELTAIRLLPDLQSGRPGRPERSPPTNRSLCEANTGPGAAEAGPLHARGSDGQTSSGSGLLSDGRSPPGRGRSRTAGLDRVQVDGGAKHCDESRRSKSRDPTIDCRAAAKSVEPLEQRGRPRRVRGSRLQSFALAEVRPRRCSASASKTVVRPGPAVGFVSCQETLAGRCGLVEMLAEHARTS